VLLDNLIQVLREVVLGATDNAKVWRSLLGESNRYLKLLELFMVGGILHLFQNNAFLHLTDILFFNDSHKVFECVIDLIRVKFVAFAHALT